MVRVEYPGFLFLSFPTVHSQSCSKHNFLLSPRKPFCCPPTYCICSQFLTAQKTPGWTATINGFFDSVLTSLVKWDLATSTAKITGKGETKYPFVLRSDIGRVLAETFRNPAEYKNRWLALANDWLSGKDIVALVEEATDKTLTVEHVEADPAKTPVIFFLEKKDGNVFDPSLQTKNLPVGLTDFKTHVKSLL